MACVEDDKSKKTRQGKVVEDNTENLQAVQM